MGKKLKYSLIPFVGVIIVGAFLFHRGPHVAARKFEVRLKRSEAVIYNSLNLMSEEDIRRNIGKLVETVGVIKRVQQSRSKRAIFIYPESLLKIKVVIFTSQKENSYIYLRMKELKGKRALIRGRLVDHEKYGLEIVVENPENVREIEE